MRTDEELLHQFRVASIKSTKTTLYLDKFRKSLSAEEWKRFALVFPKELPDNTIERRLRFNSSA